MTPSPCRASYGMPMMSSTSSRVVGFQCCAAGEEERNQSRMRVLVQQKLEVEGKKRVRREKNYCSTYSAICGGLCCSRDHRDAAREVCGQVRWDVDLIDAGHLRGSAENAVGVIGRHGAINAGFGVRGHHFTFLQWGAFQKYPQGNICFTTRRRVHVKYIPLAVNSAFIIALRYSLLCYCINMLYLCRLAIRRHYIYNVLSS